MAKQPRMLPDAAVFVVKEWWAQQQPSRCLLHSGQLAALWQPQKRNPDLDLSTFMLHFGGITVPSPAVMG